jgi:DNA-binding MarR family transcriptional regulator
MTTPTISFGQTLAFAEQALTAVLRRHLAERNTTPEVWYALNLIGTGGPGLDRAALTGRLEQSRALSAGAVRELLARLADDGLIRGDEKVDLTPEGQALFESLRDYVTGPTARFLGQFDPGDVATTIRTLQAVTERATADLAAG